MRRSVEPRSLFTITGIVLTVLGFLLAGTIGALAYFFPLLKAAATQTSQKPNLSQVLAPTSTPGGVAATAPFTVLLLGSDDDQKFANRGKLTQSMILVRVDPRAHQVVMFSVPRDLWVPLSTGGSGKIDGAYSYGGATAAIATVERNFHVHVDDYIWIGLQGLINLINEVGGVDVVTSNPVFDNFYPNDVGTKGLYGYAHIAVLGGAQHLDGAAALQYVRARHSDLQGDLGRSFRQQQVLLALRAKAKYLNVADLPDFVSALSGEVKTSMDLGRLRELLPIAASVKTEDVKQIVLFGNYTSGEVIGGQDALVPNWNLILPLVHQYFP
jgi:LCP family protein required for cell wall assembly